MSTDYASLTGDYTFDVAHSSVGFIARHAMVTKVRGGFNEFEGEIHIDGANPEKSSATATVKVASVDTRNEQRDAHLRSADFFDVWSSTRPRPTAPPAWRVLGGDGFVVRRRADHQGRHQAGPARGHRRGRGGDLGPLRQLPRGFAAKRTVNRKDFGMTWNAALETGGVLVSDKIKLDLRSPPSRTADPLNHQAAPGPPGGSRRSGVHTAAPAAAGVRAAMRDRRRRLAPS